MVMLTEMSAHGIAHRFRWTNGGDVQGLYQAPPFYDWGMLAYVAAATPIGGRLRSPSVTMPVPLRTWEVP